MANKVWLVLMLLFLLITLICITQQSEAGFFDDWNRRPGYGGGYIQPFNMAK